MPEGMPSYLRLRVVNTSPLFYFADGFENTAGMTQTFWHSLGTEAGTDNSINYWTQVTGAWTYAAHVLTCPATASATIVGGHSDWTDGTWLVRFKWVTGAQCQFLLHYVDTNNYVSLLHTGANLSVRKFVAGVDTQVNNVADTLTTGTFYWAQITASGTTYTVTSFNDTGPGTLGTQRQTTNGTISDAGVQTGKVGIRTFNTTTFDSGGAFANVCQFTGTGPDGTQGQTWTPLVTAGEPAFAWSKVSPYAGTYTASIYNANASGNGSWQQQIRLFAGTNSISGVAKASAVGACNISAGGVTTAGNPGTSYTALGPASGAMTGISSSTGVGTWPTVSCNYSGAVGTAYFDSLSILNPAYEITTDLPHLHSSSWSRVGFQPGNPSSTGVGSWSIGLHPPGSESYAAAKTVYDQLQRWLRIEAYISHDGASLGKLYAAGPITGITKNFNSFSLTGSDDLAWLDRAQPFPGEVLASSVTSTLIKNYLGTNETGWIDNFNPYTPSSYTSTHLPSVTSGTWTGTTDDGLNVVTNSTGSGAALIAAAGAASGDSFFQHYVEISGRINGAGAVGVGLSKSNTNCNDCVVASITTSLSNGRYVALIRVVVYVAGVQVAAPNVSNVLVNMDDPQAKIPFTIGMLSTDNSPAGVRARIITVNGKVVMTQSGNLSTTTNTLYPFLYGSTTAIYVNSLVHKVRRALDSASGASAFQAGTITVTASGLSAGSAPGATFLDVVSSAATRDNFFWRYTPQAYVLGSRTLGTMDYSADPGTDYGTTRKIVFSEDAGNLTDLEITDNADELASSTVILGSSTPDGGGVSPWHDVPSLVKYGVIEDRSLHAVNPDFASLRKASAQIMATKTSIDTSGAKTATVVREPTTADVARPLDKVMVHSPRLNTNYQVVRILADTFDEGTVIQTLTLDQFSKTFTGDQNRDHRVGPDDGSFG